MNIPTLPTHETYLSVLKSQNLPTEIEQFDGEAGPSLCWIGSKTAAGIILYICGGGLVVPAFPAHISFLQKSHNQLLAARKDISIAILAHSHCPTSPWPTQLRELVLAIKHLSNSRPLSSIHLAGDSSGASLHLSLLLHLNTPYPSGLVPSLSVGHEKFSSAFLISPSPPWPFGSAAEVQDPVTDMVSGADLARLWGAVMSTNLGVQEEEGDKWLVPLLNADWKELRVGEITLIAGGGEVLRGDILEVGRKIEEAHGNEAVVGVCEGEAHCQMVVDEMMGLERECESMVLWKKMAGRVDGLEYTQS